MANLDDLGYTSILNMKDDEAIEYIRQARLRRRVEKKPRSTTVKKTSAKKPTFDMSTLSAQDKLDLLAMLEAEEND